jgi:hypothetical protein
MMLTHQQLETLKRRAGLAKRQGRFANLFN